MIIKIAGFSYLNSELIFHELDLKIEKVEIIRKEPNEIARLVLTNKVDLAFIPITYLPTQYIANTGIIT